MCTAVLLSMQGKGSYQHLAHVIDKAVPELQASCSAGEKKNWPLSHEQRRSKWLYKS